MPRLRVWRELIIPDPLKVARYEKAPELGPRILFFSGGTALRSFCRTLTRYTHNSIHVMTPFDSGGSSAVIRKAFQMPAIGDVRSRIMALADHSLKGNHEVVELFAHRFSKTASQKELVEELDRMAKGSHTMVAAIPDPMRKIIRNHLLSFKEAMPGNFHLQGASIGNLVLTAGYLSNRRRLDPVIYIFSRLVQAHGDVRPIVTKNLQLASNLADGRVVVGQHLLTGKEVLPLGSRITNLWLTEGGETTEAVQVGIRPKMRDLIASADLICYPMGSFFTSILANLLPQGVGRAISKNHCLKVFVPNTFADPETPDMEVAEQVRILLEYLRRDDPGLIAPQDVLHFVLVDTVGGAYPKKVDIRAIRKHGVQVVDLPLVSKTSSPFIDEKLLADALLALT